MAGRVAYKSLPPSASHQTLPMQSRSTPLHLLLLISFALIHVVTASPLKLSYKTAAEDDGTAKPPDDPEFWLYIGIAIALVLGGGAFAGLTIALMGQDEIYLQVIATSGEGSERKNAAKVLKLLQKGKHWVLVTLLLSNVITNETVRIFPRRPHSPGYLLDVQTMRLTRALYSCQSS